MSDCGNNCITAANNLLALGVYITFTCIPVIAIMYCTLKQKPLPIEANPYFDSNVNPPCYLSTEIARRVETQNVLPPDFRITNRSTAAIVNTAAGLSSVQPNFVPTNHIV